jgi:hypothetical protein
VAESAAGVRAVELRSAVARALESPEPVLLALHQRPRLGAVEGKVVIDGRADDVFGSDNPFVRQFLAREMVGPLRMD